MPSALSEYAFLNAKLKARLSKGLGPEAMERLIRSRSLPEAIQLLRGTAYAAIEDAYAKTGDLKAGEAVVNAREVELYTDLFRFLKGASLAFVRALSLRHDIEKLKGAVRLWFEATVRGRNIDGKTGYLYRPPIVFPYDVDAVSRAGSAEEIATALAGTPYAAMARRELRTEGGERSLFSFERSLDRYYYDEAFKAAAALPARDRKVAERVLGVDVDMQNLSWLMRYRSYFGTATENALAQLIPGGHAFGPAEAALALAEDVPGTGGPLARGNALASELLMKSYAGFGMLLHRGGDTRTKLELLERALRQICLAEASRGLSGYPFSIGVALAYFVRSREELHAVMTILNAKSYGLDEDRIRSAL